MYGASQNRAMKSTSFVGAKTDAKTACEATQTLKDLHK
jgi:hypothetical protein